MMSKHKLNNQIGVASTVFFFLQRLSDSTTFQQFFVYNLRTRQPVNSFSLPAISGDRPSGTSDESPTRSRNGSFSCYYLVISS